MGGRVEARARQPRCSVCFAREVSMFYRRSGQGQLPGNQGQSCCGMSPISLRIARARPGCASRWQRRLRSRFCSRTWPEVEPLPGFVAERGQTCPGLSLRVTPLVFSVPLVAWWHFRSRSQLAEFQDCGEGTQGPWSPLVFALTSASLCVL